MEKEYRPSIGTQLLLLLPLSLFLILAISQYVSGEMPLGVPLCLALVILAIFLALRSVVVRVAVEGITVRKLFVERSLLWQDISKVSTVAEMVGSKPQYRTKLQSNNPSNSDLSINIKLLSKRDATELARALLERCTQAQVDDATKRMAEGIMPSIF